MFVQPFKPIIDKRTYILILGSFPSVKSRAEDFYYMHPKNRFWTILSKLFDEDFLSNDKETKVKNY